MRGGVHNVVALLRRRAMAKGNYGWSRASPWWPGLACVVCEPRWRLGPDRAAHRRDPLLAPAEKAAMVQRRLQFCRLWQARHEPYIASEIIPYLGDPHYRIRTRAVVRSGGGLRSGGEAPLVAFLAGSIWTRDLGRVHVSAWTWPLARSRQGHQREGPRGGDSRWCGVVFAQVVRLSNRVNNTAGRSPREALAISS